MIVVMAVMMTVALMAGSGMMGMHGGHDKQEKQKTMEKQTAGENSSTTQGDQPLTEPADNN